MRCLWKQIVRLSVAVTIGLAAIWSGPAWAQGSQTAFMNRQREIERDLELDMATMESSEDAFTLQWGGWFSVEGELFHDNGRNNGIIENIHERHVVSYDLRVWAGAEFEDYGKVFVRVRTEYVDWEPGDTLDIEDHYLDGPNLDRGYGYFDLGRAIQSWEGRQLGWTVNVKTKAKNAYAGSMRKF